MAKTNRAVSRKKSYTIGIDLGGTKLATALVDENGVIICEVRRPTVPAGLSEQDVRAYSKPPSPAQVKAHIDYVVETMAASVLEALSAAPTSVRASAIRGIGLASAGPMNIAAGTLNYPSNFLGWKIVPLVERLKKSLEKQGLRRPIHFQNDAIAAALGEGWIGRAQNCSTYAMITVGTGIGTGVIFNGQPAQSAGMGSEWGHLMVDFSGLSRDLDSYNAREVEGIASGTGLVRRAKARGMKVETASDLAALAREKNPLALELFTQASEALAALLYSLSLGFNPETFVFSGGMLGIKDMFLPQTIDLYRTVMKKKNPAFLAPVQVARLGTEAGVIGAARLPRL